MLMSDTKCKFEGPKTTFRLSNALEELMELSEICYTHSYDFYRKGYRLKSVQGRNTSGRV